MDSVFKVSQLTCEYVKGSPILFIDELEIPRGQLIFVIGKSGIGKSTLLETLGLMNNTIASTKETSVKFFSKQGESAMELKDSWHIHNKELSEFRKSHFSFIFQNTNLMPNFTAGENMMMSLLIKGKDIATAKKEVLSVMGKLSLTNDVFNKKITELSGGQRQRLAFVRAVTADFTVLFGDEPTGNLDDGTAHELMTILKKIIRDEGKTGIIVSHDLRLALDFADMIIPLTPNDLDHRGKSKALGEIDSANILTRTESGWNVGDEEITEKPIDHLNRYLTVQQGHAI